MSVTAREFCVGCLAVDRPKETAQLAGWTQRFDDVHRVESSPDTILA